MTFFHHGFLGLLYANGIAALARWAVQPDPDFMLLFVGVAQVALAESLRFRQETA